MRTSKLSRREVVSIGGLAAITAIGFFAYRVTQQAQIEQRQEEIANSIVTVQPGKTASVDDGHWDKGTMEITVTRSTWYDSYATATQSVDLGDASPYAETGQSIHEIGPYAVCELTLHSIDATASFYEPDLLNVSAFVLLLPDGSSVSPESVWSNMPKWSDERGGLYTIEFHEGDTAQLRLGYPIPLDTSPDEVKLSIVGSYTQFELDFT